MTKAKTKEIEFEPDAWQRFERAAAAVAKSPPQHRVKTELKTRKSSKRKRTIP